MTYKAAVKMIPVLALVGFLAACESSEERAEKHYQSGLALLEQGEEERALVEFRNVFNLNGEHLGARSTYARIVREQGKTREAYGQYLRLVEQYPDNVEGRIALSELAFEVALQTGNWADFDHHSARAIKAAPQDPAVQVLAAAADYRQAVEKKDDAARNEAFERAVALGETQSDSRLLQTIQIDGYVQREEFDSALKTIDQAIATDPDNRALYDSRLRILARQEDNDALEAQLRDMVTRFAGDETLKQTLIRYYMSRSEADKAEAFLREISDPEAEDKGFYLSLIQLIRELRGPEAAIAELDSVIPQVADPALYRALRASMIYDRGDREAGIAEMEQIVADTEPSVTQRRIKVNLAQMFVRAGNEVGARQLVEQVLAEDSTQVDALKMHAAWQIEGDDTDGAIATLRTALDAAPQDVAAMTLMSRAYSRAGNRDLTREFLALAADTAGQAPAESIRYARFLAEEDRLIEAEQTLVASLRRNPDNPAVLAELGHTYLDLDDMARLRQVIAQLSRIGTDETTRTAAGFETALIEREKGSDEAIAYLEEISRDWDNAQAAQVAVIRARLASGDSAAALASAQAMLDEAPDDRALRYLMAATQAAAGELEKARQGYRALVDEDPAAPRVWLQMARLAIATGETAEVKRLIAEGLKANPGAADLLWIRASYLEQEGDIEGAIADYEELYAQNTDAVVVANNLASLLASHRDDPESLERAAAVAARLKGVEQPAFQDTWGWIALRRGNAEDALTHLQPAARGLPNDAQVQYHLGRAYEALERPQDAIAQYQKAVDLAGEVRSTGDIEDARARLEALRAQ